MDEFKDTDELTDQPPRTSLVKKGLLEEFNKAFLNTILYRLSQADNTVRFEEVMGGGDTLINKGYFITRKTLENLLDSISLDEGGVWVNFGLGRTMGRVNEIQLVITAVDSSEEIADEALGKRCFTTALINENTDPPYSGVPSPKTKE